MRRARQVLIRSLHGLLWISLVGCSSGFDRAWEQYVPRDAGDPVAGRWRGFWKSYRTEHQGALLCIISKRAEGRYDARYRATYGDWWKRSFEYTVHMEAKPSGDAWKLQGRENLGWAAGGIYHYRGEINGDTFQCLYSAQEDRGVFELTRHQGDASSPP